MRALEFVGSAREDLRAFPQEARIRFGYALYLAQQGEIHLHARPLRGFSGAGVLEIAEDVTGDTYRVVYTVRLRTAVYVLHAFQKKSKRGRATPRADIEVIRRRLARAQLLDAERSVPDHGR
jgi:phage-related protein